MPLPRGSRFPRTRGSSRRRVSWIEGPFGEITNITTTTVNVFPTAQQFVEDDLTIVRTRGELLVGLTAGDSLNEGFKWAFGMCVVSENAAGVGVTAIPAPLVDIAWDGWLVYLTGQLNMDNTTLATASDVSRAARYEIDSKAMRKVHRTDTVVAMFGTTIAGTTTMQTNVTTRMLMKLP